eukprot:PITA_05525
MKSHYSRYSWAMKSHYSRYSWAAMAILAPCFSFIIFAHETPFHTVLHNQSVEGFSIEEATIPEIQQAFKAGKLTSRGLVEFYLDRIKKLNTVLHAVMELNPDALLLADMADTQRLKACGTIESALHGIPVLIKDSIVSNDKLNTTAGSFSLLGSKVARDAGVVKKLRKSGAIILGKASMSEWADVRSSTAPNGWSPRGGQVKNPYVLTADPSGSSTGSAVAVAANMAAVTLGTETAGSILSPSSVNGVVGIKPTVGLTSRAGVIPVSHHRDTVGPICRTVTDAVYLLDEIVGYDPRDHKASKSAAQFIPNGGYKQFLKPDGLHGKRLGIFRGINGSSEAVAFEKLLATLRQKGATLVANSGINAIFNVDLTDLETVFLYDFKQDLNMYLSELPESPVRTLADVIAFNIEHPQEEKIPEYGQDYFLESQKTSNFNAEAYKKSLKKIHLITKNGIDKVLKDYKLDALVTLDDSITYILAIAGYPGISVPAGYNKKGVPFGLYFGGGSGSEATLVQISYAFEYATQIRKIPSMIFM